MSQMVTRKRTGGDEKEKRTDSPVKDMKKKMAANAEKEKNAIENKSDKPEKPADKPSDKPADKSNDKSADKSNDKPADKSHDKSADKPKSSDKVPEKTTEKKDANEKKKEDVTNGESSGKPEKPEQKKADARAKQNGSNGLNGTVSADSDSDDLVIDEPDEADELFPELAYDDSDIEWEPTEAPSRSLTRRSQVKATRTPETPRPASGRPEPTDESKDSKVLKLNQEGKTDAHKPETKKSEAKDAKKPDSPSKETKNDAKKDDKASKAEAKNTESPKKDTEGSKKNAEGSKDAEGSKKDTEASKKDAEGAKKDKEGTKKDKEGAKKDKEEKCNKIEVEVVVEIESSDPVEESRKPDTNFSKSRVKVSPYRRSMRLADQTVSSITANYTGNNTTMEMDITETSSMIEPSLDDSYLSGLRSIRGRRSYKPLKEMTLINRSLNRSALSNNSGIASEQPPRPTGTVVGRKRKPEADSISIAMEAEELPAAGKRQRLLDRLARPFRAALLPRRNAEIVGINTDLPLSAPVASAETFDPETLKPEASSTPLPAPTAAPIGLPAPVGLPASEDSKRCAIM